MRNAFRNTVDASEKEQLGLIVSNSNTVFTHKDHSSILV